MIKWYSPPQSQHIPTLPWYYRITSEKQVKNQRPKKRDKKGPHWRWKTKNKRKTNTAKNKKKTKERWRTIRTIRIWSSPMGSFSLDFLFFFFFCFASFLFLVFISSGVLFLFLLVFFSPPQPRPKLLASLCTASRVEAASAHQALHCCLLSSLKAHIEIIFTRFFFNDFHH